MSYSGSCHCGAVQFTVEGDPPQEAVSCNCSICRSNGALLAFVSEPQFTLVRGADSLTSYRFNAGRIEHRFCATCGVEPFARGSLSGGTPMIAINLRCVPEVDLGALKLIPHDGAAA